MRLEDELQKSLVCYIRLQYPHARLMHVPLGELRPKRVNKKGQTYSPAGAKLKAMGASSGFPDLIIYHHKPERLPLHLELKTKKGRVSDNRREWIDDLSYRGQIVEVAFGLDEAIRIIDNYLK